MKNLLLVFVFVLISLTGFSQTFTLSTYTPGLTQQTYTVSVPAGNGYTYLYTVRATNSTVVIASNFQGMLAWLSNTTVYQQQNLGSGIVHFKPAPNSQYQDIIRLMIANGTYYCYGYAQLYVSPF